MDDYPPLGHVRDSSTLTEPSPTTSTLVGRIRPMSDRFPDLPMVLAPKVAGLVRCLGCRSIEPMHCDFWTDLAFHPLPPERRTCCFDEQRSRTCIRSSDSYPTSRLARARNVGGAAGQPAYAEALRWIGDDLSNDVLVVATGAASSSAPLQLAVVQVWRDDAVLGCWSRQSGLLAPNARLRSGPLLARHIKPGLLAKRVGTSHEQCRYRDKESSREEAQRWTGFSTGSERC